MTKKWSLTLVLVLALTMALSACGGNNKAANNEPAPTNSANTENTGKQTHLRSQQGKKLVG